MKHSCAIDRLMKSENFEMALDEIIWLITLLANQSVLIHNLQHPEDKKEPLTQDAVELLTSPFELAGYKEASVKEMIRAGPKKGAQNQPRQPRSFQGTSEKEEKIQAESSTVSPWVSRK